ncbi:MAG: peptidase caspase catalytic subunit p20 [Planctomycetota bacterium]|nr:peptidase caspase catalytic subunit p20 [Planctomycetota bacterium]
MKRAMVEGFRTFAMIVAGLAVPGAASASGFLHVIVVTDDSDPKVGDSVQLSGGAVAEAFRSNVPPDRFSTTRVGGRNVGPVAILGAIRALPVRPGQDMVVVYSATHGGFDRNQGSYLFFPRTRQSLTRKALRDAIEAKGARLGVLITESCNNVKEIPGVPSVATPMAGPPPTAVSPLFRALFLSHAGFVDLASSKPGERSLCYPRMRIGRTLRALQGALFTEALIGAMGQHAQEALTWEQICSEVATVVRSEFARIAPEGLEDEDAPDQVQRTQTVDLRSPGTWSPTDETQSHVNSRLRLGALGQGMPGVGVKVVRVFEGSAAQKMGLEANDVIRAMNGVGVDDTTEYVRLIKNSGEQMTLDVRDWRTGKLVRLQGKLDDARDDAAPGPPARPRFGAVAVPHNGEGGGLFVTSIVPQSAAAKVGLEYGDIILTINGRDINGLDAYYAAVRESPREMELTVRNVRNGQPQSTKVTLDY